MRQALDMDEIYAAAAHWHSRLDDEDPPPAVRAEFDAWLAANPRHREAFAATERMWLTMSAAHADTRILDLRRRALNAMHRSSRYRLVGAAAMILAAIGLVSWLALPNLQEIRPAALPNGNMVPIGGGSLRTAVGERVNAMLADGSAVALNTTSELEIHFTADERRVRLLKGQAWFQVAKNPQRPFVVEAGNHRVIALGTAFDVRIDENGDTVQVTLAEGRVSVEPIRTPLAALLEPKVTPAELAPGEVLIASRDGPLDKRKADVAKVASWRQGQIVFDNDTLEAAVAEVNRYSSTRIELADPTLGAYRVSGVFKAGNSESFIETVTGHYPIRVAERTDVRVVLATRGF